MCDATSTCAQRSNAIRVKRDGGFSTVYVCVCHTQELISQQQLKEYIAYARARITPKISSQAADELARVYASMRADGRQKKVVVATPRQLESLIRLSEAQARMRLSANVTKEHVEEATRLW